MVYSSTWFTPCFTPRLRVPSIISSHHRPTAHATHAAQGPTLPPACPSRHGSTTTTSPSPHRWAAACCARPRPPAGAPARPRARLPVRPPARPPAAFFTSAGPPRPARAAAPAPARAPPGSHGPRPPRPPRRARPEPIDLRRWAFFGHPLHAEVEESSLPGRPVGLGHFRPFPNGFTGPSSAAPNNPDFWAHN